MRATVEVHWLYDQEAQIVDGLKEEAHLQSVCIDKRPEVDAILRLTLAKKELAPTEDLKIHAWSLLKGEKLHFFFVNDQQNDLLKAQHPTACNL